VPSTSPELSKLKLTPDQLAAYHRDGFLLVDDVFPQADLDAINREIERLRQEKPDDGTTQHDIMLMSRLEIRAHPRRLSR
jgi:hypothetical protein